MSDETAMKTPTFTDAGLDNECQISALSQFLNSVTMGKTGEAPHIYDVLPTLWLLVGGEN